MLRITGNAALRQSARSSITQFARFSSTSRSNSPILNDKKAPTATKASSSSNGNNNTTAANNSNKPSEQKNATSNKVKEEEAKQAAAANARTISQQKQKVQAADFSWLPKAPKLKSFSPRELRLQSLYSGYRPVFMEYRDNSKVLPLAIANGQILLDEEPSIWSYSATEMEYYPEWEKVPLDVAKDLKPYDRKLDEETFQKNLSNAQKLNNAENSQLANSTQSDGQYKQVDRSTSLNDRASIISKGRKRYLPGRYMKLMKTKQNRKSELKRLLEAKNNASNDE